MDASMIETSLFAVSFHLILINNLRILIGSFPWNILFSTLTFNYFKVFFSWYSLNFECYYQWLITLLKSCNKNLENHTFKIQISFFKVVQNHWSDTNNPIHNISCAPILLILIFERFFHWFLKTEKDILYQVKMFS